MLRYWPKYRRLKFAEFASAACRGKFFNKYLKTFALRKQVEYNDKKGGMTMEQIRLGTIGSGVIVESILDQVIRTEGIRLTAVYSRSREKGMALARKYGAEAVYTDLDAFFREGDFNCVYIASPNSLHYPQAKQALLAGKHVWCEKPFCTNAAQARELFALAEERGRMLAEAVPTAFYPNLEILRQLLPGLGRLRIVQGNYSQYSSRYDALREGKPLPNVFNPEFGGGCLVDINFYNVYLNVALFGKPRQVHYYPNLHSGGVDTSGILILDYGDFLSQATGAKDCWNDNSFSIQGEDGFLQIPGSNGLAQIRLVTRNGEEVFNAQPDPARLSYEVQALTRIFLTEDSSRLKELKETTLAVMEVLEDARKTAGIRYCGE